MNMKREVAFTSEANTVATNHLLEHFRKGVQQEDLCFALWRLSTGANRSTALIDRIILPEPNERALHGNASFNPQYLLRVLEEARHSDSGIAFMHSHPGKGWQDLSSADTKAERDVIAYPAGITGLPLVGMTIGADGYWSARFWQKERIHIRRPWWKIWASDIDETQMSKHWCQKVRIVGLKSYELQFNDAIAPIHPRQDILRRTYDTWGSEAQNTISRLHIGVVGLGSVGSIVAEAIARIGVGQVTLIDPDKVEVHNLDRLLYGTKNDVGVEKVRLAKSRMESNATADNIRVKAMPLPIQQSDAYESALDCDLIFSCVDRPIARDVLTYVANAHLIPVIDGGIAIEQKVRGEGLASAHWRSHIVTPYHQCLRCNGQYNTSLVVMERDGSLDDPTYISNLPAGSIMGNQNVFPFSLATAGMMVNLMIRYMIGQEWWPEVQQQDYQFVTGETRILNEKCYPHCEFRKRKAKGDAEKPPMLAA